MKKPIIPKNLDIEIVQDWYVPQFGEEDDIEYSIDIKTSFGDYIMENDEDRKRYAKNARKMAKFFNQFADWVEKQK